jgi:hypothetical protein
MSPEIEKWLAPMLEALLMDKRGGEAFARFMETAIASASDRGLTGVASAELASPTALADMLDTSPDRRIGTVDWVRLGQLIRRELAWDDYPAVPPTGA